jgi:lipopolysaccharide exporter
MNRQIAAGAAWVIMQRLAVRMIGLISTLILVRLLAPEDFGLVALATAFSAGLDILLELGFDFSLITEQTDKKARYDTAWTLTILRGVGAAALLVAAAWPIAAFYHDDRLVYVVLWLAFSVVLSGFQNIGTVDFRKDLQLDREFRLLVWSKVVSFTVTIALAWFWRDYRALLAGIVAGKCANAALSYTMHAYRPRLSLRGASSFLHFSKWLFVANIVALVNARADRVIIGKIAGTASVGIFAVAHEISTLATTELIWPIARALFPGYARMAKDMRLLARAFLDALGVIMLISAPVTMGIALMAEPIVRLALGPEWFAAIPIIQILALYGFLDMPTSNVKALFLALNRPDLVMWRDVPSAVVLVPALIVGVNLAGPVGAAWALVLSAAVTFSVAFGLLRRNLDVSIPRMMAVTWRPFIAAAVMGGAVAAVNHLYPLSEVQGAALLAQMLATCLFGAVVYVIAVLVVWWLAGKPPGAETHALGALSSLRNRLAVAG